MFLDVVLVVVCLFAILQQSQAGTQCTSDVTTPVKVVISSRQNQTGHWISQVGLQQNRVRGQAETVVEVEHSTTACTGSESTLNMLFKFTAPPPRVRSDYEFFAGLGYYKFHNVAKTFEQARQTCAVEGAHLAVINSEKESAVLKTMFSYFADQAVSNHKYLAWIGIQLIGDEHFSILGAALKDTGFTRWSPGQPTKGIDGCVALNKGNGGLDDLGCRYSLAFICEYASQENIVGKL